MNATDFLCGLLAGWAQVFTGQPFDFIKVRIQTAQKSTLSSVEIANDIYKLYGLKGFYRGSSSMLFGFAGTIGTEFLVYEWTKRQLYRTLGNRPSEYNATGLKLWEVGLAGGVTGWIAAFIYCPVQYTKIQRQLSGAIKQSSLGLLFKQLANNGLRNIYRGYWVTTLRQVYGSICYYSSYESIVRACTKEERDSASSLIFLSAGAIAGVTYHLFTYPIDTIKSNIQAGMNWKEALANSLIFSKLAGYKVVLMRAVIVNSCSFWVYESAQKYAKFINNFSYTKY